VVEEIEFTLAPPQDEFINSDNKRVAIIAAKGYGKAQPLWEPVLTPAGFVYMHEIEVGDYVIGSDGKPTKVNAIHWQGKKDVYEVRLSDRTSTRCTLDHLWAVQTGSMKHRGKGFKVKRTKELLTDLKTSQGYNKWHLPLCEPVEYSWKPNLKIPPYALGAWLGDGGMSKKSEVVFSTDLMQTKSNTKFIPKKYLYSSVEDRINLLRGLMDTKGNVTHVGTGEFCTTSAQLASDVVFLCQSLGLTSKANKYSQRNINHLDYYLVLINSPFNPFSLPRKADKFNINATQGRVRGIDAIEKVGRELCQCISVDAEDGLYVTKDFIVTHNTWSGAKFIAKQAIEQPDVQHLIMLNTLGQARDIFYQDIEPLLQDLGWPYHFSPQYGNLKIFDTTFHVRSAEKDSIKRIESIYYGSGWADEVSFFDYESFKIFFSRIRVGKSLVRVTSMPDDPEHWMYSMLDKANFTIHEKSLYDNPDKEFVKNYEEILNAIYEGPQLKRYLSGERVSLAGMGIFNVHPDMKDHIPIDPEEDIVLSWDFNVAYRAVSAWQKTGRDEQGRPIVACVKSWQMKEDIVYQDAVVLAKEFKDHEGIIYLGGDASENKRSSQTTESIWQTVRRAFKDEEVSSRSIVPIKNPNVKDTVQCCNWSFKSGLVNFDQAEKNVYSSLQAAKADKYGEIDKSGDNSPGGSKSHEADTARYALWYFFKNLYPGGTKKAWVV